MAKYGYIRASNVNGNSLEEQQQRRCAICRWHRSGIGPITMEGVNCMRKISENLRYYRLDCGYEIEEVAGLLGVSKLSYAMCEVGDRTPDLKELSKLADIYGCSADELLGRTPIMSARERQTIEGVQLAIQILKGRLEEYDAMD